MSYSREREMTAESFIQPIYLQNHTLKNNTPYGLNKRQLQFHFLSCLKLRVFCNWFLYCFLRNKFKDVISSSPNTLFSKTPDNQVSLLLHFFYFPKEYKAALKVNPGSSLYQSSSTWIFVLLCFLRSVIHSHL